MVAHPRLQAGRRRQADNLAREPVPPRPWNAGRKTRKRIVGDKGGVLHTRSGIALLPEQWVYLDALAKPWPWNGNRSAWLRDHLDELKGKVARGKAKA